MAGGSLILDSRGNPIARSSAESPPAIRARYDSAQTSRENQRHWSMADGISAKYANSKEVRYRLRTRARYEADNNGYLQGILRTLQNDVVGTGPRLQLLTPDQDLNRSVELAFSRWSKAVNLPAKLRTMRRSLAVDGEAFGMFITNPRTRNPVQLDIRLIEADQISSPFLNPIDPLEVDGIRFDERMNPVIYKVLKRHPGDWYQVGLVADDVDARRMVHWFLAERPGQVRGVPEITPSLELFGLLRRYTLAVVGAAEIAADFAAVLQTTMPPGGDADAADPFERLHIERRMMTTLPAGWSMNQFRAEQPTTTYPQFKRELLTEAARCVNMPYNIAAGDSSSYNYSSGRLDHQTYYKSLGVTQYQLELVVLDPTLEQWLEEAALATGLIPAGMTSLDDWPHQWFWDGHEHVDPAKEASAQETRLRNNTTTLADEYARRGQDWEAQIRQRAKELALQKELGIAGPAAAPGPVRPSPFPQPDGEETDAQVPQED